MRQCERARVTATRCILPSHRPCTPPPTRHLPTHPHSHTHNTHSHTHTAHSRCSAAFLGGRPAAPRGRLPLARALGSPPTSPAGLGGTPPCQAPTPAWWGGRGAGKRGRGSRAPRPPPGQLFGGGEGRGWGVGGVLGCFTSMHVHSVEAGRLSIGSTSPGAQRAQGCGRDRGDAPPRRAAVVPSAHAAGSPPGYCSLR